MIDAARKESGARTLCGPPRDQNEREKVPVHVHLVHRHKTENEGQAIAPQFGPIKAPHNVAVPHEPLVGALKETTLQKVARRVSVYALQRVCQVVRVRKVKARRVQDTLNHVQVDVILCLLRFGQMRDRNVRDEVKAGQAPNHLTPHKTHKDAVSGHHQVIAAYDADHAQNTAYLSDIGHLWNDLRCRPLDQTNAVRDPIDNHQLTFAIRFDVEPLGCRVAERREQLENVQGQRLLVSTLFETIANQ